MKHVSVFLFIVSIFSQLDAQVRYRPLLMPLFQKPTQVVLALGCCAHAFAWHHKQTSKKIVASSVSPDKKQKVGADQNEIEIDLPYEKFKHELTAQISSALGSALFLYLGNHMIMSHLQHKNHLPPFNKKNAIKAFMHILGGWSGVQFFMLPYGICKILAISPEWAKFLEEPAGKNRFMKWLKKRIAIRLKQKENSRWVKGAAYLVHTALMKDINQDAKVIQDLAKQRAWQYGWAITLCAEWALLATAYLACAS